ncbi:MAG TPA: hypothetical protein VGK19_18210 [Capsulimonadaceae bacterium]|jgi:hypothetical protein
MITTDNTAVERALALAAPIYDKASELCAEANAIESVALAGWYQSLLRQVINANIQPNDIMPWKIKRTSNCFVDVEVHFLPPRELYELVRAGWLDWVNLWIDAKTNYHRDLVNDEAALALELLRAKRESLGEVG